MADAIQRKLAGVSTLPALQIDSPMELAGVLNRWCGVGPVPDERVARAFCELGRAITGIASAAGSAIERHWQAEAAQGSKPWRAELQLAWLLADAGPAAPVEAVREALGRLRASGLGDVEQFAQAAHLWGRERRPIVVVLPDDTADHAAMVASLVQALELAPDSRLWVIAEPAAWDRLLRAVDPHTRAVLQQGLTCLEDDEVASAAAPHDGVGSRRLEPVGEAIVPGANAAPAGPASTSPPVSSPAVADRTPRPAGELRDRARVAVQKALGIRRKEATASDEEPPPAAHEEARSLAEALLFAALQADGRTAGLFRLNADGGFQFGARAAEVDLLCAALGIAIEVDGYFHFQDSTAYRRDRAKDWLMQCHGLLVLRFLAQDVTEQLDAIVERVARTVALRREQRARGDAGRDDVAMR